MNRPPAYTGYFHGKGCDIKNVGKSVEMHLNLILVYSTVWGCGSPVVKVLDHGRHVKSSSPVPLKTRRVGQRCTLNLSRAQTSSRWCGVVVRREGCKLRCRPRHLTMFQSYVVQCDVNIYSLTQCSTVSIISRIECVNNVEISRTVTSRKIDLIVPYSRYLFKRNLDAEFGDYTSSGTFERKALRTIFGPVKDQGCWRTRYNFELHWCAKIKDEVEKLAYQLNEEAERTERPIRRLSKVMYGSTCADMQVDVMGECLSSIKHVVGVRSVFLAKRLHAV
ncbi:uncharacterized protein TNCV_2571021 [Trichonephila clavipes]|nr:uncharacterized protein TNCV_2571021 [Trichonephila clavipes]